MNCSLDKVYGLITAAIAALTAAIVLSWLWATALPLFAAAALVASVVFYFIPAIKSALLEYAACRGRSDACPISFTVDTLGQAAAALSAVSFAAAGVMQISALAFLYSWALAWIGVGIMAAVAIMVQAGQVGCAIAAFILIGVLSKAWSYKKCMDNQQPSEPGSGGVFI